MRSALAAALAGLAGLLLAPAAHAELAWAPCPDLAGYECGRLDVPLDRSGAVPGTLGLDARRVRADANPRSSAVVALAGGPGQSAVPLAPSFASALAPGIVDRDLLVFDQRGTGRSGRLNCRAFSPRLDLSLTTRGARCAQELGARRAFFTTRETVADLEALRLESGYERLVLYGVSYGTKVALAYAAAYPERVERLILDSVVTPEGPDPLQRSTFAAMRRALGELCRRGACRAATSTAYADLGAVARRLGRGRVRTRVVSGMGRRVGYLLDREDLFDVLLDGDLNPVMRAETPAAVAAARRGDPMPLGRLAVRAAGYIDFQKLPGDDGVSLPLYAATICEEAPFPWDRGADARTREAQVRTALAAVPASSFAPFDRSVAFDTGLFDVCLGWPPASAPQPPPGPLPAVPTLVLAGTQDLRTPLEDARRVAARIPGARVLPVPFTGHSVLGSELSGERCAERAVAAFFADRAMAPCTAERPLQPAARPPTRLDRVAPLRGTGDRRAGRTVAVVLATVTDLRRQTLADALELGERPGRVGGLRGGSARVTERGLTLQGAQYVPGVRVSGDAPDRGTVRLRVRGGGALAGSVRVDDAGTRITGRLGGRRFAFTRAAPSARGGAGARALPDAGRALRRYALRRAG